MKNKNITQEKIFIMQKIKQLREITQCRIMECDIALKNSRGSVNEAIDLLKKSKQNIIKNTNLESTLFGTVSVFNHRLNINIVELNSESNFIIKNKIFLNFMLKLLFITECNSFTSINYFLFYYSYKNINMLSLLYKYIILLKENINIKKIIKIKKGNNKIFVYMHNRHYKFNADNITCTGFKTNIWNIINKIGHQINMHITASSLKAINLNYNHYIVYNEKNNILHKIFLIRKNKIMFKNIHNKIKHFIKQITLLEQDFVLNVKTIIKNIILNNCCIKYFIKMYVNK